MRSLLLTLLLAACGGSTVGTSSAALLGWTRADIANVRAMRIYAVDMEGDSDLDLFVSQRYGAAGAPDPGRVLWLENGAAWAEHVLWSEAQGERGMIACRGDLDGSGAATDDFVVPMEGWPGGLIPPTIRAFLRDASHQVTVVSIPVPSLLDTTTRTLKGCDLADRDGDGDLDLALSAGPNPRMLWSLDGPLLTAQQSQWVQRSATNWGSKLEEPAWCDVVPGGTLELCVSEEQQGRGLVWFDGIGSGVWTPSTISDRYSGSDGLRVGLYDGDSLIDVLGGWECSGCPAGSAAVSMHFSGSHTSRQWAMQPVMTGLTGIEGVEACDLNLDGVRDVAIVGETGETRVLISNATLTAWTGGVIDDGGDRWLTVACGDFNGDGWPDLAVGGETLGLAVFTSPGY